MRFVPISIVLTLATILSASDPRPGAVDYRPTPATTVGWRGDGTGVYPGATLPAAWNLASGQNLRWRADLPGTGSPIVVGDAVLVAMGVNGLRCLDLATGSPRWTNSIGPAMVPGGHLLNPLQSTPVSDGKVVVFKSAGGLGCFGLDGVKRWRHDRLSSGTRAHASPVIADGLVLWTRHAGRGKPLTLIASRLSDGSQAWESKPLRHADHRGGTLLVRRLGTMTVAVTEGGEVVKVADGSIVAALGSESSMSSSPTVLGQCVVCSSGSNNARLATLDAVQLELDAAGAVIATRRWSVPRSQRCTGSPLAWADLVFLPQRPSKNAKDGHGLLIYRMADGASVAPAPAIDPLCGVRFPSPIQVGKRVLVLGATTADAMVIDPGKPTVAVARHPGDGARMDANPVPHGNRLLLRTTKGLYAVGGDPPSPPQEQTFNPKFKVQQ
jgi:hypothetical protein